MRIFLRLENKTDWHTRDLQRFVKAGFRAAGVPGGNSRKPWEVEIRDYFCLECNGSIDLVYIEGLERPVKSRIILWLPAASMNGKKPFPYVLRINLAQVLIHEIDHWRGLDHPEMPFLNTLQVPWAENYQIRNCAR